MSPEVSATGADFHSQPRFDAFSSGVALEEREEVPGRAFRNPLLPRGQDPFVTRHGDNYYYVHAGASLGWTPVYVSEANSLTGFRTAERVPVWTPAQEGPASRDIWAPKIKRIQGTWWMNVAAWSGRPGDPHRMYSLQGGEHPQDPYTIKGELRSEKTSWGIDGTMFEDGGDLYYVWSGKDTISVDGERDENGNTRPDPQNIYISRMENPWTLTGETKKISVPQYPWEKKGPQPVNEGPQVIQRDGTTIIINSASNTLTDDYCLGMITNKTSDLLEPEAWVKYDQPVFAKTDEVFGPGHASYITTPRGGDWIIYHSAQYSGSGLERQVNAQPFTWSSDGLPLFGRPVSPHEVLLDTTAIRDEGQTFLYRQDMAA